MNILQWMVYINLWAGLAELVWQMATGWAARGSNPSGGDFFRTRADSPLSPHNLLYNGYRVYFPGIKRLERGVDYLPRLAPRLKKV
jgi:hypothetical protein